jgi:site-specific DNA-methyltransferase (adenine-specific)
MQLIQGDCLDVLKTLPYRSVDMVLVDLPYGTTQNKWDSVIPLDKLWAAYGAIVKEGGALVFTASQPFTSTLVSSKPEWFKHEWIWKKNTATGHLNAKRMPMKLHESVVVFCQGPNPYYPQGLQPYGKITRRGHNGDNFGASGTENLQEFTNYPRSILEFSLDTPKLHPTQKPIALMEYLIRTYTREGETVLDNCMGSGSTGVACVNTGRNFIGIEQDQKYFQISQERLGKLTI